jgi:hypothetical protein
MVFNTTFNNISVISWWTILLVEETRVPGEIHTYVASITDCMFCLLAVDLLYIIVMEGIGIIAVGICVKK